MQKAVLKLHLHCEKTKQKAMATVSYLSGVTSMDMKEDKLTVTGDIDAYRIVKKLKKVCHAEIITFGPAKEPEKKKPEPEKKEPQVIWHYPPQCPPPYSLNGYSYCADENPNGCIIS